MDKPADAAPDWLVMVAQLPTEDPAARMRVLRTLESLGAAVIREGAYLLPNTPANRQSLDSLTEYVARTAGATQILHVTAASAAQRKHFVLLFDRTQRYESLIKTIESLRVGFGQADPSAISRVLHKQRREFEAIAALDFFPTAVRERTHQALIDADKAVRELLFSSTQTRAVLKAQESLRGRAWATRKPLWADRLACAWLIRRFVDPEGSLTWLEKTDPLPPDTIGFGFEGAHFTNSGARVAYEEMLARLDLTKNAALSRIGNIVHYLEVQGDPVPEASGTTEADTSAPAARCGECRSPRRRRSGRR